MAKPSTTIVKASSSSSSLGPPFKRAARIPRPSSVSETFAIYSGPRTRRLWLIGFVPKGSGDQLIPAWGPEQWAAVRLSAAEAERIAPIVQGHILGPIRQETFHDVDDDEEPAH
jgi:hypothetical protein